MALPLVPAFPCQSSFPHELRQHSLYPAPHQRRLVLRTLTHHPASLSPPQSSNLTPSDDSPCSTCSTQSMRLLWPRWPRLPITYNETALTSLHGRLHMRMPNCISILLPPSNDKESPTDPNDQSEESPAED